MLQWKIVSDKNVRIIFPLIVTNCLVRNWKSIKTNRQKLDDKDFAAKFIQTKNYKLIFLDSSKKHSKTIKEQLILDFLQSHLVMLKGG